MNIKENISLADYSTMRLGGPARYLAVIRSKEDLTEAVKWAEGKNLKTKMIGVGSNIIWSDEGYSGLVLVNKIPGFDVLEQSDGSAFVTIGAGEDWDKVVEKTVASGYSGIEFLSLIPGTAGATPVQNVGAYGREIKDVLVSVEAYDRQTEKITIIHGADCDFKYRSSRFRTYDKDRYFITAITLHLTKTKPMPPFYASLQTYLDENNITDYTPSSIRKAVINIRSSKLPDPASVANNGSFFHNPIIDKQTFLELQKQFPGIPSWPVGNNHAKIAAGWLIEQAGFPKGTSDEDSGMGTWKNQALVLVNQSAKSSSNLIAFRDKIKQAVKAKFGIELTQEPEFIDR